MKKIGMCGLFIFLGACQNLPLQDGPTAPITEGSRKIQNEAPIDSVKAGLVQEFTEVCLKISQIKDRALSQAACDCVARNHRERLESAEIRSLVRKYRAGKKKLAPADAAEADLWDYDLKLAEECVRDASFTVSEEP